MDCYCPFEECVGACGDSPNTLELLGDQDYKKYQKDKIETIEEFLNLTQRIVALGETLSKVNVSKALGGFNDIEEANRKLDNFKQLNQKLGKLV